LAIESYELIACYDVDNHITKNLESILLRLYYRKITPIKAVKLYNNIFDGMNLFGGRAMVGGRVLGKIQLSTYLKSFNCAKKIDGLCNEKPVYPDPRYNENGYFTNLDIEDKVCWDCADVCSRQYLGCARDTNHREIINGKIIEYCTNCWNVEGEILVKKCRNCSTRGNKTVGLRSTMILQFYGAVDTTDLCSVCYMEEITENARKLEQSEKSDFSDYCFCCEEIFNGSSLVEIQFFDIPDLGGLNVMTDEQLLEGLADSTIGDSKYFCTDCIEYYEWVNDDFILFAVDNIVTHHDTKFYFGSLLELLIEGEGFRIYKKESSS